MFLLKAFNEFLRNKYFLSNWHKKKFVWRYSIYFSTVFLILIFGLFYTATVRVLLNNSRYNNQACNSATINRIQNNYIVMIVFVSIICCINFIFSRLTFLYSNYTNGEFFNLGFYCTIVGFLLKYIAWFLSFIYILWVPFLVINAISVLCFPEAWCSPRYNMYGQDAVDNCTLIKQKETGCEVSKTVIDIKPSESCNDFNILTVNSFIYLVRSAPKKKCSLTDKKLCDFFVNFILEKNDDWTPFSDCVGKNVDLRINFFLDVPKSKSDFYLLSVSYILYWIVTLIVLLANSVIIKLKTPVDPSFILSNQKINIFFKFTRIFDIWR